MLKTITQTKCKRCGHEWFTRVKEPLQCPACKSLSWKLPKPKKAVAAVLLLFLLTSCAGYRPIVDMQNVNPGQYETDLKDCQAYAEQISPATNALIGAGVGLAIGTVAGAIIGAAVGAPRAGAKLGAALGGTQGAISGGGGGMKAQVDIIRNCMAGRGYRILQ